METANFNQTNEPLAQGLQPHSNGHVTHEQGHSNGVTHGKQGMSKGGTHALQGQRKALATPMVSHSKTPEALQIKGAISQDVLLVSDPRFPMYQVFVLSPESSALYIKVSRSQCISLTSKQRFATNIQGYPVTLV